MKKYEIRSSLRNLQFLDHETFDIYVPYFTTVLLISYFYPVLIFGTKLST